MARPELGAVGGAIIVWLFFGVVAAGSGMFTPLGIVNFLEVSAQLGILAVAAALLMIGGEFDLSLGSMIGFAGMVIAHPRRPVRAGRSGLHPGRPSPWRSWSASSTG